MPRVDSKKKEYMIKDLPGWIAGRMHSKGLTQEDVAKELGISQVALSVRLNPKKYKNGTVKDPFSYGNLLVLFKLLDVTDEEKQRLLTL